MLVSQLGLGTVAYSRMLPTPYTCTCLYYGSFAYLPIYCVVLRVSDDGGLVGIGWDCQFCGQLGMSVFVCVLGGRSIFMCV